MSPTLFVDIDGVMRTGWAVTQGTRLPEFSREAVDALKYIIANVPNLHLVLSSAWRWEYGASRTKQHFASYGIRGQWEGETPDLRDAPGISSQNRRQAEIARYLSANSQDDPFVILDDNTNLGSLEARQVKGMLTMAKAREAVRMLTEGM